MMADRPLRILVANDEPTSRLLVRATPAKAIGLTVTAEGIENLAQARVIQSFACEMLQGYSISTSANRSPRRR